MVGGPLGLREGASAAGGDALAALERGRAYLLAQQNPRGWWKGELQTNVTMDAEDILLREFLGIRQAVGNRSCSAAWIRSQQRGDGSWSTFHDGPGDLSTTIEAYVALRLAGDVPDAAHMRAASAFAREAGGIERARVFTHIWLALFGAWPWKHVPELPPELMLLPLAGAAEHLRLRLLGATDGGRAFDRARGASRAGRCPSRSTSCTAPTPGRGARGGSATARALALADRALAFYGRRAVRPLREAALAPRRALDRAPAGGRRVVGRHPAPVGLLADRPAPARLSDSTTRSCGPASTGSSGSPSRRRPAAASRPASRRSGTPRSP